MTYQKIQNLLTFWLASNPKYSLLSGSMQQLPYPQSPTEQEVLTQERYIHLIRFFTPTVIFIALVLGVVFIAIAISYNFNPMNWLE